MTDQAIEAEDAAPVDGRVAAAVRGDGEAMRVLWEEHRRWVAAILLAHKPSFEDLDDLLQEVAASFVAKVHTLRDDASLRGWLRTVAINAARAAGRNGKYRPRAIGSTEEGSGEPALVGSHARRMTHATDRRFVADDEARRTLDRVAALPELYREPLLMRVVQGMRSRQIAEALGISPALVDTRIARARTMLRDPAEGEEALASGAAEGR